MDPNHPRPMASPLSYGHIAQPMPSVSDLDEHNRCRFHCRRVSVAPPATAATAFHPSRHAPCVRVCPLLGKPTQFPGEAATGGWWPHPTPPFRQWMRKSYSGTSTALPFLSDCRCIRSTRLSFCWHSLIVSIEASAKGRRGCIGIALHVARHELPADPCHLGRHGAGPQCGQRTSKCLVIRSVSRLDGWS